MWTFGGKRYKQYPRVAHRRDDVSRVRAGTPFFHYLQWSSDMHELPITQSILDIVVKHAHTNNVKRVLSITLRIGELSDLDDEWIQKYFDYLSKDTVAEMAKLKIERAPVVMKCNGCSHSFEAKIRENKEIACPECGSTKNFTLISGREYYVKDMEVR